MASALSSSERLSSLISILHGSEAALQQYLTWEQLFSSNPLFDRSNDIFLSRADYMIKSVQRSLETYRILKANKDLLAAHSPLHGDGGLLLGDLNISTGIADHFGLFVGTLLMQATREQQAAWLRPALALEIIGTYAQTELGHGSNVRGLETVATYDQVSDEFVVHSPSVSSTKWWPGGLGLLATHAIVYARLLVDEKDYGFHAFVVPIRDREHNPMPGVECGDVGPKLGYSGYDSGYLRLTRFRIPRFNLLAKFQQVAKGGAYTQAPKALQKISYFTMLRTRVVVAQGAGRVVARAATIATRFVSLLSSSTGSIEKTLAEVSVKQRRCVECIAVAYALLLSSRSVHTLFHSVEAGVKRAGAPVGAAKDRDHHAAVAKAISLLPELHTLSAGLKAFTTDIAVASMDDARDLCGPLGLLNHAGFATYYFNFLPAITYEGDIVPMALQCARFLFKSFVLVLRGQCETLGESVKYLRVRPGKSLRRMLPLSAKDLVSDPDMCVELLGDAARRAVARASFKMIRLLQREKMSFSAALNACSNYLYTAAKYHTYFVIAVEGLREARRSSGSGFVSRQAASCVEALIALFALTRLLTHVLPLDARLNGSQRQAVSTAAAELSSTLVPSVVDIVNAFGFSDHALCSSIGAASIVSVDDMCRRVAHASMGGGSGDALHTSLADGAKNPINSPVYVRNFRSSSALASVLNTTYLAEGAQQHRRLNSNALSVSKL